jgi:hypothetical protein
MSTRILEKMFKKVTKIVAVTLIIGLQSVAITVSVKASVDYLDIVDTVSGFGTYYSLGESIDISRVRMALMSPSADINLIDNVRSSGSIDKSYLTESGKYTLALGYKVDNKYLIIEKDSFNVKEPTNLDNVSLSSFLKANSFGIGGDLVAQAITPRFRFSETPTTVEPLEDFSVTVSALNASGQVDSNYKGTIVFEVNDVNAQLPEDYTFLASDAGVKKFENAISLAELGSKTLKVKDKTTNTLMGEVRIAVATESSSTALRKLELTSPTPGTSTVNQILFSGSADSGLEVQILDKGVFLAKVNADAQGKFSYTTTALPDGDYIFKVKTSTAESDPVAVKILTSGSALNSVTLNPNTSAIGGNAELTVNFKEAVNSASAVMNGARYPLIATDATKKIFRGTLVAPIEPNEYPVNLDVTSETGVRSEIENAAKLTVTAGGGILVPVVPGGITFNVPSQIANVELGSADKRVNLNWEAASDDTGVAFYRIFYGTSPTNLDMSVDTNSSSTSWFVPDLENGVRYYFSIYGVDTEGNQADQGSRVVSIIPGVEGSTTMYGSGEDQIQVGKTADTGPALYFAVLFSMTVAYLVRFNSKRKSA